MGYAMIMATGMGFTVYYFHFNVWYDHLFGSKAFPPTSILSNDPPIPQEWSLLENNLLHRRTDRHPQRINAVLTR